jgi:predicted phosphate transport protein (TIGR00153 family)
MPAGSPLGKMFGRSPVAPLQHHMQHVEEGVQLLCQLLQASVDGEVTRVDEIHALIESNAEAVRDLHRDIRRHLPRGLLLAMPRPDLLELLALQEQLARAVEDAARPVALRGLRAPAPLARLFDRHCTLIANGAGECLAAIREMDEMIEQGFGDNEQRRVEKILDRLDRQLLRAREHYGRTFRDLCKREDTLPAVDCLFLHRMLEALDRLAAGCGAIGEQLRLLMAR